MTHGSHRSTAHIAAGQQKGLLAIGMIGCRLGKCARTRRNAGSAQASHIMQSWKRQLGFIYHRVLGIEFD